jgi:hypothetical protein
MFGFVCARLPSSIPAGDWFAFARACHAEPLVLRLSRLPVRPPARLLRGAAGLMLVATPRPPRARLSRGTAGLALVATPGPCLRALITRNRWSCAFRNLQSPGGLSAGLARLSPPLTSSVPPPGLRSREFHWNSAALVQFQ